MALIKSQQNIPVYQDERKQKRECSDLLAKLTDPDSTSRRWAARDIIDCPGVVPALIERLKIEQDISVREVIITTLIGMADPEVVNGLAECLRSEDTALRNEAIEAMKQLPAEMAPIMRRLLTDPDPDVRIFAVNILESLRHMDVEAWLIEVINNDPHINVCATAVDLFSEIGTEAALKPLEQLKARFPDEPYIEFAVNLALKRIRGE